MARRGGIPRSPNPHSAAQPQAASTVRGGRKASPHFGGRAPARLAAVLGKRLVAQSGEVQPLLFMRGFSNWQPGNRP